MRSKRSADPPPLSLQYAPRAGGSGGISPAWWGNIFAFLALLIEVPILATLWFSPETLALISIIFFGVLWLPPLYLSVFPLFMIGFVRTTAAFRMGGEPVASTTATVLCFVAIFLWISPILYVAWRR